MAFFATTPLEEAAKQIEIAVLTVDVERIDWECTLGESFVVRDKKTAVEEIHGPEKR